MSLEGRVLSVIESLYDAALDEARWPQALRALAGATGSQAATFWVLHDGTSPRLPTFEQINFDPAFIAEYLAQVAPSDPTVRYLVAHPQRAVVHDGLVISERDKDRHPYYDWHARHSDTRYRLLGRMHLRDGVQAGVALHRARKAGRYEGGDIERFTLLHEHLERALAIGFRLGSLGTLQRCTAELLDRQTCAVLLLDADRRVVHANARVATLSRAADGVRVAGTLSLDRARDNDRLQRLIGEVLGAATSRAPGGLMTASRPSGKRPYSILVTPVSARAAALTHVRPAVCVAIADPDDDAPASVARLRTLLKLTPAEARLAAQLAAGVDLRSASVRLGITYGTARARLADVFRKTGTRRQAELVRMLVLASATG